MGEDMADLYEAEAERSVIPFLTASQVPDWKAYNGGSTNTVDARIKYDDVDALCNRIRANFLKAGPVFWLVNPITNGQEMSISQGSYAITNKAYNPLGYTPTITNITYSYSTNRYVDNLVATSSRQWTNGSLFEYRSAVDGAPMTLTNTPVSYYVWSKTAYAVSGEGLTLGSAWPFARSYTFPWEQWLDVNRGRIYCGLTEGINVTLTNVLTLANSGNVAFYPARATAPGYAELYLEDASAHQSEPFFVVYPPLNNNYLSSPAYIYSPSWGAFYGDVAIRVNAGGVTPYVDYEVITGDGLTLNTKQQYSNYVVFYFRTYQDNTTIVVKFSHLYQLSDPIYCIINAYRTAPALTNDYFGVTAKAFNGNPVTAVASTNAMPSDQIVYNDKRITTNKLYDICHVLTNLHTTVYMGATVTPTQNVVTVRTSTEDFSTTWYVDEYQTGSGLTPTYYSAYTIADIISDNDTRSYEQTVTNLASSVDELAFYSSSLYDYSEGDIFANPSTNWTSWVVVAGRSKDETYKYKGCSLNYPSDWAVTNGYVKNVKVYAIVQVRRVLDTDGIIQYPFPSNLYTNNFTISGSYWYAGNINCTEPTLTFSRPATNINTTISNSAFHSFSGFFDDDRMYWYFTDKTPVSLIAEIDNPTEPIRFDMPDFDFSHAYPDRFTRIQAASAGPTELRYEYERSVYDLEYSVGVVRWIVQVEWNFKHFGNGFTAVTNTPAGR
jgi:hypothetical protein